MKAKAQKPLERNITRWLHGDSGVNTVRHGLISYNIWCDIEAARQTKCNRPCTVAFKGTSCAVVRSR